jgi:hypothetical protein
MADVDIQGQPAVEDPEGQPSSGIQEGQVEPFHKYEDQVFKTPDELNEYLKTGTMRQKDYTQKTMSLAEERKAHENAKSLWLRQQAEMDEKVKFYKDVDEFFKANPRAYAEVKKLVGQGASRSDIGEMINQMFEEKVGPKLSKIEEFEKQENAKAERARHFAELKKKYPDFDEEAVSKSYDQLMSPESTLGTLYEHLYHANRGRSIDPTQIQKETIDDLEKKSKSGFPSAKGAVHSTEKKANNLSIKQLAEKMKKEAGG